MSWGVATQNGVSVSLTSIVSLSAGVTEFSPADLFTGGTVGAWYDPSDYSTLFQDSAGTTPVTAVEQPVRLMRDKSGNNNHATAPNDASRPVLRARYNFFTYSEDFSNAAWKKSTTPAITLTNQGSGVWRLQASAGAWLLYQTITTFPSGNSTFSIEVKSNGAGLDTFRFMRSGVAFGGNLTATSDWVRYSTTGVNTGSGDIGIVYSSTSTAIDVLIRFPSLVAGSSAGTYQRIAAATDYATAGFLPYLAFDGVDDFMVTGNINLSGTDKANVLFGATQLSAANYGGVASFGPTVNDAGSFLVWLRSTAGGGQVESYARGSTSGTSGSMTTNAALAVPSTFVWSTLYNIGQSTVAEEIIQRQNDAVVASTGVSTAGTGNFGNLALHIGRYNASNYLNGRLYQMIIPGKALSASELASAETWNATKTGVTL